MCERFDCSGAFQRKTTNLWWLNYFENPLNTLNKQGRRVKIFMDLSRIYYSACLHIVGVRRFRLVKRAIIKCTKTAVYVNVPFWTLRGTSSTIVSHGWLSRKQSKNKTHLPSTISCETNQWWIILFGLRGNVVFIGFYVGVKMCFFFFYIFLDSSRDVK